MKTAKDVADLLRRYQAGEEGLGLLKVRELVEKSEVPQEVKRQFLHQYYSGLIMPDTFE